MKLNNKNNVTKIFKVAFICLIVSFIWGNSLATGTQSSSFSNIFVDKFIEIFSFIFGVTPEYDLISFFIRKLAHFTQFFILGFFVSLFFEPKKVKGFSLGLSFGLFVASVDELIQRFTPERYGCLQDVLIDFSGYICGVFVAIFIVSVVSLFKEKRRK